MNLQAAQKAQALLAPHLRPTPLFAPPLLEEMLGFPVALKLETLQPTGSFKTRPAFHGILRHLEEARRHGVIASSSGNFAQAVAYAAKKLGVRATLVMMRTANPYKIERTRALGADVVLCGPTFEERWTTTECEQKKSGAVVLHPFDSEETLSADGTIAIELSQQAREAGLAGPYSLLVPASGGGMAAGVSSVFRELEPDARVVAVQPSGNGSLKRSFQAGLPVSHTGSGTIADALTAARPGERALELIRKNVEQIVEIEDTDMLKAVRLLARELKLWVEPGGAIGLAALLAAQIPPGPGTRICILSGGNLDPSSELAASVLR